MIAFRGTDISYDDIAMRFLDWPKPVILKIEKAKGGKLGKFDVLIRTRISYIQLLMSGFLKEVAIVRMNAYNNKRRIIKSFEVDSIQQN